MKLSNSSAAITIFQLIIIILISIAASYTFMNTQTNIKINEICFYRYLTYGMTAFFSYICLARYNKHIAFLLSIGMAALVLSPSSKEIVEVFPLFVSFFATLMGITTVLVVPAARGRGFFEFLLVLILPAVLAESRLGGFPNLIVTSQSIAYYQVFLVTIGIVGGYFYLRYATLGNLARRNLLSRGERKNEANAVNSWTSFTSGIIIVGAIGTAAFLAIIAPAIAGVFQPLSNDQALYAFVLMGCIGIVVIGAIFAFQILTETK